MAKLTIYHNPRCSKSRQTLEILNDNNADVEIVEYLKNPPSQNELKSILKALDVKAEAIMRKNDDAYKEAGLDDEKLTETQKIAAMTKHPKVIERPIVIKGKKGVIGRPPENVLDLL